MSRPLVKRMLLMLVLVAAVIAGLAFLKYRQIEAAMAGGASFQPPPEAVTSLVAREQPWPETLTTIGTVVAVRGVTVTADLPGVIQSIRFESGRRVGKGDVLVELDAREERAQLVAAQAELELARANYARAQGLFEQGIVPRADFDRAEAEARRNEARVGQLRATIERKVIRAPFGGVLGIRQVNLGQYLNPGDPIVPLQTLDPVYVHFDVPQQEVEHLQRGMEVRVSSSDAKVESTGRITAIDAVIDPATRNVKVQATLANSGSRLVPGMFVDAHVVLDEGKPVVTLPASSISYAPYGDSVFVIEAMKGPDGKSYRGVRQQFVKLGGTRGDDVAVTSGIRAGQEIVTSGVFKLRNGAAVQVNNKVQPGGTAVTLEDS